MSGKNVRKERVSKCPPPRTGGMQTKHGVETLQTVCVCAGEWSVTSSKLGDGSIWSS